MGAELSQQRKERPRKPKNGNKADDIVRINRSDSDVPEAYRMVQISDDVFQRIQAANEQKAERIREEQSAIKQQEQQQQVPIAEAKAEAVAAAVTAATTAASIMAANSIPPMNTEEQIDQQLNNFYTNANRVERVFFSGHNQNAYRDKEKIIIECLAANPKQVYRCQHLRFRPENPMISQQ